MTTNTGALNQRLYSDTLISIIMPAYNCEKFISQALDSLVNQDYPKKNYEIIITDDGSTDSTGKICDDYAARYSFINVTHTKNMGVSHARNTAMYQCKGEYITLCDGDDEVSPQLISVLTKAIELYGRPDIIAYSHLKKIPSDGWPVYDIQSMKASDAEYIDSETLAVRCAGKSGGYTWNKIFRRELAQSISFDESLMVSMDHYWLMSLLSMHKDIKICCINYYLYHYVKHPGTGQTRQFDRIYDDTGMRRSILTYEKTLALPNLSPLVAEKLKGKIYIQSINTLYRKQVKISSDSYTKLKDHTKRYAYSYYAYYDASLYAKIKIFIKHILTALHIHK